MKLSYLDHPCSDKVRLLVEKIIDLLVGSEVTNKEARDALTAAEDMLSDLKLVK